MKLLRVRARKMSPFENQTADLKLLIWNSDLEPLIWIRGFPQAGSVSVRASADDLKPAALRIRGKLIPVPPHKIHDQPDHTNEDQQGSKRKQ
jgi:hypothetical protein